jgi:predicted phosphodiesterase
MQINILHISDLHLAQTSLRREILNLRSVTEIDTYKRFFNHESAASFNPVVVGAVSELAKRYSAILDGILITGDISTSGDKNDLKEAFDIVDGISGSSHPLLGALTSNRHIPFDFPDNVPVFLLPGNHDRYYTDKKLYQPGSMDFHDTFSKYWVKNQNVKICPIDKGTIRVGLVLADFSLKSIDDCQVDFGLLDHLLGPLGPLGLDKLTKRIAGLAQGYVDRDILEEMVEKTNDFVECANQDGNQPIVIWAIHFPPRFPVGEGRFEKIKSEFKKLVDENELIDAAKRCDIRLIVAGHTHEHNFYQVEEIDINCAGSATQFMGEAGELTDNFCHILRIDIDTEGFDISVYDFKYDKRGRQITAGEFRRVY